MTKLTAKELEIQNKYLARRKRKEEHAKGLVRAGYNYGAINCGIKRQVKEGK